MSDLCAISVTTLQVSWKGQLDDAVADAAYVGVTVAWQKLEFAILILDATFQMKDEIWN